MAMIGRIKYDGPSQLLPGEEKKWLVYKFPGEKFVLGSQLIVNAGQEALFYYTGAVLDSFGPGRHTLTKGNLPLIQGFVNIPFGNKTPFTAEIYFINKISKLDLKWGTKTPFQVQDPKFGLIIDVRAYGRFGIKIKDSRKFLKEIIGVLSNNDIINHNIVTRYFKGLFTTRIKNTIANLIIKDGLSIFDITASIDQVSETCWKKIEAKLERFGLSLVNLYIESINIPQSDVIKLKSILEKKAEFTQIGDERYVIMRQLDFLEKLAENPNQGGGAMGLGAGLGAGIASGKLITGMMDDMQKPSSLKNISKINCQKCGYANSSDASFCGKCGNSLATLNLICPECNKKNAPDSLFCSKCGTNLSPKK